jgi:hypothetical protein
MAEVQEGEGIEAGGADIDIVENPEAPVDPRPPSMNASSNPKPSRHVNHESGITK